MSKIYRLTKNQLEETYVEGHLTLAETAAALGSSIPTVARYMALYNIPRRKKGAPPAEVEQARRDRKALFKTLYADGFTLAEIGDRFDLSRQRVHMILKDA